MVVIGRDKLVAFSKKNPDAADPISAWLHEVENAAWENPHDVKAQYPSADPIGGGRIVFDICGNKYRIVVVIRYVPPATVMIRFVGTHAQYDKIDAKTI